MRASLLTTSLGVSQAGAAWATASSVLFEGATIVTFDSATESIGVVRNGSLLVRNDRIVAINEEAHSMDVSNDTERVDVEGQIITPGFIDTHRHGWGTAFKTLLSNTSIVEYVLQYRDSAAADFLPEDIYLGQLAGLYETMNAGVTTTLDHAHHTWSESYAAAGLNASLDSGTRVFWAYSFQNTSLTNFTVSDQIPQFREMARDDRLVNSLIELGIAYDGWGPVANTNEAGQIADLVREFNVSVLTTHCSGGVLGSGNMPEHIHGFGILNETTPVVFSHATYLTEIGSQLLRSTNQFMSITPESEKHFGLGHKYAYFNMDQAALGVDLHSAFSGDILTQARMWLQESRHYFTEDVLDQWRIPSLSPMSVYQAFMLATRKGGLALRRPDLGVIEVGAKADLVVWDAENSPSMLGWADPVAAVILHASVGDILHVMVNGKFVKKDKELVAAGYPSIRKRFLESARRLQGAWAEKPHLNFDGQTYNGFEFEAPRLVDVQRGDGNGYGEQFLE
jgi:cytosine/adenosine deaminase-related metal-dependent hydrolase